MKKHIILMLLLSFGVVTGVFSQSMIISGGSDHAVAICDKGKIYAWGKNDKGQLCLEDKSLGEAVATPSKVKFEDPNLTFSQISAGSGGHNIALSCKKTVYCWGDNTTQQCGRENQEYISDTPVLVYKGEVTQGYDENGIADPNGKYLGGVRYVCGTTNASMAILEDGTAVWWGKNPLLGNTPTSTPLYIRDEKGNILQNVVHIMGGDDNILLVVGDSPDAQVGTVYSAGVWNGRGGTGTTSDSYAKPVEIASDEKGTKSSGKHLQNVRMTGIADQSSFAVDGSTGYVYGWGSNGWGCGAIGGKPEGDFKYASKVLAGEYEEISGQPFLTDVKQVIGGNGCGAAITEEGHLIYWGMNMAKTGNSGGVIPNSTYKNAQSTCELGGPVFANYCAGVKGPNEVRVDDAISIGRGDLVGFMVNSEGKYFVWGSTNVPGKDLHYGIMGTGKVTDMSTCLKEIVIPCENPDICPEPFMNGPRYKCPGVEDSLYSGFTPVVGHEDRYFFIWKKDGVVLNSITINDIEQLRLLSEAERKGDKYNAHTIPITEAGLYEVEVLYIGTNVPCENCPEAKAKIEVIEMQMPVDTTITTMNCVADPLKPSSSDIIKYSYTVNDKFYKSTQTTTFAVFSTIDSKDTLGTYSAKGAGGQVDFTVTGDNIKEVHDNKNEPSNDTTYTVWIEDITRFETILYEETKIPTTGYTNSPQYLAEIINLSASSELNTISLFGRLSGGSSSGTITVTPRIYKGGKIEYGQYMSGDLYWSGKQQTFTPTSTPEEFKIICNVILPANSVRGSEYVLYLDLKLTGAEIYTKSLVATNTDTYFSTPFTDSQKTGILGTGALQQFKPKDKCNAGTETDAFNIVFGKMTDYTCGRIMLTARYGCPPCNQPDGIVKIEVDGAPRTQDTISLCEESDPIRLSVSGIKKSTEPNAVFDELWFLDKIGTDAQALHKDLNSASSALGTSIEWKSAKEGQTEKYYIKIRDNEKPDASACFVFDSIVVKYNKRPVAPTIDDIAFCENATSKTALDDALNGSEFAGFTVNWYNSTPLPPLTDLSGRTGGDAGATKPDLESLTATNSPYTFVYSVTDKETGCESDKKTFTVTVYPVPNDPIAAIDPFCVKADVTLPTASPIANHTVSWYKDNSVTTAVSEDLSTLAAGTYDYYYTLTSAAPENCVSDPIMYTFIVKPYVEIELDSVMSCGVTQVSTKILRPQTASIKWMLDGTTEVATPVFQSPTYVGNVGKLVGIASALNYCDSTSLPLDVYVKATASEPTGDLSVTYLKSDANPTTKTFKNLLEQNSSVVTEETGYTLVWYDENGNKLSECPTPPYPAETETNDQEHIYKVSRVNADGCESTPVPVKVMVYLTPAPIVTTAYYCKGSTNVVPLTAEKSVPPTVSESDYTLQWYDTDKTTKLGSAPTPDVSAKGKITYYVTQVSKSGAESSPVAADVVIYDVPEPQLDATNVVKYCAESSMGSALNASLLNDASNYMMSSSLVWSLKNENGAYDVVTTTTPSLDVKQTTTYEYQVHQTYTIASTGEICVGPDVQVPVTVTYVPEVTTKSVLYLKASANADGSFSEDILTHDDQAVTDIVSGATLQWYESDGKTPIVGTPTPKLDPSILEGEDQKETYYVSQYLNGCYSVPVPIEIRISDALPPFTYAYHYCEGETMDDLKADCQPQGGKSESSYEIYWYGTTKPASSTTQPASVGPTFAMNGAVASLDATGGKTEIIYYVAQHDKNTDAVSAAQPVVITIYPQPEVLITTPQPVCEQDVDMSLYRNVTNVTEQLSYSYYSPAGSDMGISTATVSGTYGIDASYTLPVNPSQYVVVKNQECRGQKKDIAVVINDLTVPTISGDISTCPGTNVTLTASATSNDPGVITYQWGGDAATTAQGSTTDANFVSTNLSTTTGDVYSYTVTATAGACVKSVEVPHTVTIGDGKVIGNMTLVESDNKYSPIVFENSVERIFYSCGNPIEITVAYDGDSDYEWYDETGTLVGTGKVFNTNSYADYNDKEYTVKFTNQCPTSAKVTVHTIPLTASSVSTETIEICEGEVFTSTFNYTLKPGETPSITWSHNGAPIGGQVSNVLTLSNTTNQDDGVYSYKIENRGCMAEGIANSLNVRPYIKATIQSDPFIVDRNETETLPIYFTTPVNGVVESISWKENESEVFNGNPYVITDVTADHYYEIILSDPEYCSDTLHATVYVDAKLQLTTSLKDTLCLGTSEILTIDTTGTGNFRRPNGNPMLNITGIIGGISYSLNDKVTKQGDLLQVVVNPEEDAKYVVSFTYGSQNKESEEEVLVIPAISLTVPPVPNVCEGEETTLTVTNVAPEGTTVSWISDPTILEGENSETVRVKPSYKGGTNHQSLYTYQAVAYNAFCNNSKTYSVQVLVDEPLKGQITGISEICEGGQTTFEASSYEATTYFWTTSLDTSFALGDRMIVQPSETASYYLEMTRGLCSEKDTFVVTVHTNPVISSIDSIGVRDRKITLDPEYGTAPFLYAIDAQPADDKDVKTNLGFVKHVVYVSDYYGCQTSAIFVLEAPEIDIPIIVTPDGNGLNDRWRIPNLAELYPNAIVTIYDRFGKQLAQYLGADSEGWDCTYQGQPLPSTDYWYQVTIEEINKEYVGHFTLIRR